MERKSFLYVHKCHLKICLARARTNILKIQDCISWVPVIVPPERAAFHSSSILCVFLPHSSASSDLKLSRTLPLASACQMCSSPCCILNDCFHSWLQQVSEECEARGMPVPVVGLWSASSLGQGLCPGGCGYSRRCPWQLRDFCLHSCSSHPSLISCCCSPVLTPVLQLVQPIPVIHGVVLSNELLKGSAIWVKNLWKRRERRRRSSYSLCLYKSPLSALCCLSPASCFEITHPSKWELKQLKLSRCVLTSAATLVFLLKL